MDEHPDEAEAMVLAKVAAGMALVAEAREAAGRGAVARAAAAARAVAARAEAVTALGSKPLPPSVMRWRVPSC